MDMRRRSAETSSHPCIRLHFGLQDRPFELSDAKKFYFRLPHEIASITLSYSLEQYQGLAMLTGAPGTGKTTLLSRLIEELGPESRPLLLSDAGAVGGSLTQQFASQLGIRAIKEQLPEVLGELLAREASNGRMTVLMLDESQNLTPQQFAEVLFLSNRFALGTRSLQIFLVGQRSLETRLAQRDLESLNQRVSVRTTVEPLTREQTASYITFRLRVAGAVNTHLFTPDAMDLVFDTTEGVARLINILCERALAVGYAEDLSVVDRNTIVFAIEDLPPTLFDAPENPLQVSASNDVASSEDFNRVERKLDHLIEIVSRGGLDTERDDTLSLGTLIDPRPTSTLDEYQGSPLTHRRDPFTTKV